HYAVAFGVLHGISKYPRTRLLLTGLPEESGEVVAVENVVAEHQRTARGADEIATHQERLRDSFRPRLHHVLKIQAEACPIPQQLFEPGYIVRRRNDENVPNARQHQRGEWVVNHGLVV